MNTDVRRAIFSALMASEDYMDAFYRLFSLKLPSRQEREIAHVLVHCCTHEKAFNPFYALVAGKFLESRHNFVITFKYAFWDRLKQVIGEEFKIKELVHVAKFFGFLLGRRALPLSILKRASFTQLSETVIIFLQILFVSFLESGRDDLQISLAVSELDDVKTREKRHNERENIDIFGGSEDDVVNGEGVNDEDELQQLKQQEMAALKTGLRIFFKQFMEKATELPTLSKPDLVQRRIGLVLSNLE
jgi:nucleolar MIF4G domain-containing protein 1